MFLYVWYRWLYESVDGWIHIIPYVSITIDNKGKEIAVQSLGILRDWDS